MRKSRASTDDGVLIEFRLIGTVGGRLIEWPVVDRFVLVNGVATGRELFRPHTPSSRGRRTSRELVAVPALPLLKRLALVGNTNPSYPHPKPIPLFNENGNLVPTSHRWGHQKTKRF